MPLLVSHDCLRDFEQALRHNWPARSIVDTSSFSTDYTTSSLNKQSALAECYGLSALRFCPDTWALRHRFINQETGEVMRARCNSWTWLYCGSRKVDRWRQHVKAAEPTLFLTLTKAGHTVEECACALTTFLQYLRRGSKGRVLIILMRVKHFLLNTLGCLSDTATLKRLVFTGTY